MSDDEWLYATQAAQLAGVTVASWRRATLDCPTRPATAPKADIVHPGDGRRMWRRSTIEAYVAERGPVDGPGNPNYRAEGRAVHEMVARHAGNRPLTMATYRYISTVTGITAVTVRKHLTGACDCRPERA